MTAIAVVLADVARGVDVPLVTAVLARWGERAGIEVTVEAVTPGSYPTARAVAETRADGVLVDIELVRLEPSAPAPAAVPVVYVDLAIDGWAGPELDGRVVFGRGLDTFLWAAKHLAATLRSAPDTVRYGPHRHQFGELRCPPGPGPHPVVVLVHGGFWKSHWELDLMDDLAIDLAAAGWAAWNVEYRRGPASWRHALDDVAAAVDHVARLAEEHGLDLDRVALVGHSAGGHLVLWAAGRRDHGPEPSASDLVHPALVVPLAPVTDLVDCAHRGLGDRAAQLFLGADPGAEPARYRLADPMQRLPVGAPTVIVQGLADGADLIDHNRRFTGLAARVGAPVELLELDGIDHFHVIDPATTAWAEVRRVLADHVPVGADPL